MAPRSLISVAAVLLCLTLGLVSEARAGDSQKARACCTRYNHQRIPFRLLTGYREQRSTEMCNIDAIIFFTVRKKEICATEKDEWVRRAMDYLSSKLKGMSKAAEAQTKKRGKSSLNDGSGSFSSTTEPLPNSTEGFYE
uniref:C-C motif chemokine 20-like n=1 Tax=Semicossyphus pulcher TaxID=241346 RepID=UPI0037E84E2E